MNINAKLLYTVSMNREELNLVRRALDKFGGKGPALASKMIQDLTETRKQLVAAIDAALKVEADVPVITLSNEDRREIK